MLFRFIRKIEYYKFDIIGWLTLKQFKSSGKNVKFWGRCNIKNPQLIEIGNNVSFNDSAYVNGLGGIKIGNNVALSASCILVSTGLESESFKNNKKEHINRPIIIGNNVQVGAGAIILAGVIVGDNVIVGAGAVVTKNISSNCIVAGNPAKLIRSL
jgi:maltose O-acetyltransferase